jgi:hypothetical protein
LTATVSWAAPAPVKIDEGDTVTPRVDITVTTTATLVAAANSSRAVLSCTTDAVVRWGSSSVSSSQGQRLAANSSIAIANTAAIYMATESGAASVSCTEESYSASSGTGVFSP